MEEALKPTLVMQTAGHSYKANKAFYSQVYIWLPLMIVTVEISILIGTYPRVSSWQRGFFKAIDNAWTPESPSAFMLRSSSLSVWFVINTLASFSQQVGVSFVSLNLQEINVRNISQY